MTPDMILDYLGILVDTTKVSDLNFTANIILPEGNYVLRVKNGVLLYQKDAQDAVTVTSEYKYFNIIEP